jgi:Type II CAAX prenyl endopeptidase Rce1-like
MNEVLRSVARQGVGHLAVSWNEEMVFRGYGFETVREALGQGKAVAVLIPGFALYHGLDPQQVLGMLAGGATLMLLRLHTDALWMPVGYHWAWNVLQTAIFGTSDSAPSVRPLQVQGPSAGWANRVPLSQGCLARWCIWRWRCSSGCGCGVVARGAVEHRGHKHPPLHSWPKLRPPGQLVGRFSPLCSRTQCACSLSEPDAL